MEQQNTPRGLVLLVSPLPPPTGGIATWTRTLLDRGLPGNFEIEVVNTSVTRKHFADRARLNPAEFRRTFSILKNTWSAVRSGRCSVVHINHAPHTGVGILRDYMVGRIAAHYGVPFVIQLRGTYDPARVSPGVFGGLQRRAYNWVFKRARTVLALDAASERCVQSTLSDGQVRTQLLPNFIEGSSVPPRSATDQPDRPLRVVFAGTLIRDKGVYTMLELARRVDGIHLTLVGRATPEMERELQQAIDNEGLHDRLQLAGELPNDEVRALMAQQDVCLLPSWTEGFPMSALEAMVVGLPVVASPVGALPDMIDVPEGGFLVPFEDVDGYVEAITTLRDDRAAVTMMGNHNRERALRDYDYDVIARKLVDLYSDIAHKPTASRGSDESL